MKPEIRERYQDVAKYDQMMPRVFPGYDLPFQIIGSYLSVALGDEARVLDVGCGTGEWLMACAEQHPGWRLAGVDPTEPMLDYARAKADGASLGGRVAQHKGTLSTTSTRRRRVSTRSP